MMRESGVLANLPGVGLPLGLGEIPATAEGLVECYQGHEPVAPDLPGLSKYAVEDWRIFYSIDRDDHLVDIHGIVRYRELRS